MVREAPARAPTPPAKLYRSAAPSLRYFRTSPESGHAKAKVFLAGGEIPRGGLLRGWRAAEAPQTRGRGKCGWLLLP